MSSRFSKNSQNLNVNIWIAFTDLISNAFLILILFFLVTTIDNYQKTEESIQETPDQAPPIIIIPTTGSYQFKSGKADIPESLRSYIEGDLITEIYKNYTSYQINVVEVIGHTDGQAISSSGNLDIQLEKVMGGHSTQASLVAGSNADLGLMRAMAVVSAIRSVQSEYSWLEDLQIRAYSAGQMILPTGLISGIDRPPSQKSEPDRRRIEIRFTRLGEEKRVPSK